MHVLSIQLETTHIVNWVRKYISSFCSMYVPVLVSYLILNNYSLVMWTFHYTYFLLTFVHSRLDQFLICLQRSSWLYCSIKVKYLHCRILQERISNITELSLTFTVCMCSTVYSHKLGISRWIQLVYLL